MFVLALNDMRMPQIEMTQAVARADTREALVAFLQRETVETYTEPKSPGSSGGSFWGKTFRKGGPLEWYNQPSSVGQDDHGIVQCDVEPLEDRRARMRRHFEEVVLPEEMARFSAAWDRIMSLPVVG